MLALASCFPGWCLSLPRGAIKLTAFTKDIRLELWKVRKIVTRVCWRVWGIPWRSPKSV